MVVLVLVVIVVVVLVVVGESGFLKTRNVDNTEALVVFSQELVLFCNDSSEWVVTSSSHSRAL